MGQRRLTAVTSNIVDAAVTKVLIKAEANLMSAGASGKGDDDCLCSLHFEEKV